MDQPPCTNLSTKQEEHADSLHTKKDSAKKAPSRPPHALPISGERQGSNFIVTNASHWGVEQSPPTATLPQQRTTPATATITRNATTTNQLMQTQEKPKPKQVIKSHLLKAQMRRRK
jgi:hypothetical protein